jgi:hypothetical protein
MADRTCAVLLFNNTPFQLTYHGSGLNHGKWIDTPPDVIEPKQWAVWKSSSKSGAWYGTEGAVDYRINGKSDFAFFEIKDKHDVLRVTPAIDGILHTDFGSPIKGGPHCFTSIQTTDALEGGGNPDDYYWANDGSIISQTDDRDFGEELLTALELTPLPTVVVEWLGSPIHHPFYMVKLSMLVKVINRGAPDSFIMTTSPSPRPTAFVPILNGPSSAWIGEWQCSLPEDNSIDVRLRIREGSEPKTFAVELEDKTRFTTASYSNVPLTTMPLLDYTGGPRKERPLERADVPVPHRGVLELSETGSTIDRPSKPSIGGRFSKMEGPALTSSNLESASTERVDSLH